MGMWDKLVALYSIAIFLLVLVLLGYVSYLVDQPLHAIAAAFYPLLLTFITAQVMLRGKQYPLAWIFALLWPFTLLLTAPLFSSMSITPNIPALIVDNILLGLLLVALLNLGAGHHTEVRVKTKEVIKRVPEIKEVVREVPVIKEVVKEVPVVKEVIKEVPVMQEQQIRVQARSLEEKCKGLNSAVGRVYRKGRGGGKQLRSKLSIPTELYNEFSKLLEHEELDTRQAAAVLNQILGYLQRYALSETEVFGETMAGRLRELQRAKDGSMPVIDVLEKNDNDPVRTYFEEGVNTAQALLAAMTKGQ
ncbi:hypothetical protein COY28_01425 [Candidatus Woesearchaeota archaeon CG_4_10_14_0_2_um_filter_57_5]|nr:MAG: hypothetical protein AUJ68_01060 [Candidatus Woesearchaeota archaeon CG1_02_57_44]PIN70984.1 MAG: hypothetical protein COV94_00195 [Candidatus Woesearchaeota archaeon CG11_big_fil_rev_8_21_14_0_20_57_5]PIZ55872.1 MAG: hypothetical protein COY28_01425 [Candidatus Woesearchaeota archaeon CG_4_10_14_0_2_um_filter_57_5]